MGKRRLRRLKYRDIPGDSAKDSRADDKQAKEPGMASGRKTRGNALLEFYDKKYKALLIIPFIMLLLAIGQIGYQYATTGDFINKGVSLKGGTTITIPAEQGLDLKGIETSIKAEFPKADISVKEQNAAGKTVGAIIEADLSEKSETDMLIANIERQTGIKSSIYSVDVIGPSLGSSFFKQTLLALLIAFVFMGVVVFFYFRTLIPSLAVILAAFSDMTVTLAIINMMGIKLSTAGIAAFLMLIGYSIDTDIVLSTRVLKDKEGSVFDRVISAVRTGLTMNFTTMAALIVAIILSRSEILTQIMTILLIGLLVDIVNTWLQNVGILRMYMDKKGEGGSR